MNEIQSRITKFANQRHKSINHCLYVLGADWEEVYCIDRNGNAPKKDMRPQRRSIYDNFNRNELLDWASHLYRESLIEYHPDKHPGDERLYTEICQELSKAYLQAKKILLRGKL